MFNPIANSNFLLKTIHKGSFLALVILLFSCGKKEVVKTNVAIQEKPQWVDNRPVNSSFYIGIGSCSKTAQPLDYQNIAKKNAFNDLATEISVRIQAQTFLNSLEVNKNFSEEFISTISTTSNEQIEDYEIAGIWENKTEYWIYYRLNKSIYQGKKLEKKNQALSQANDYYLKGKDAESVANIPAALDLYLHGLFALKNYWNEVNEFNTDSGKIYLDNELYSSVERVTFGLSIRPSALKVVLSSENNFSSNLPIKIEYDGKAAKGIPVTYAYQKERYMKPRQATSDSNGEITAEINDVNSAAKNNSLDVSMNIEMLLPTDLDKTIQMGLIKNIRTETKQVPIEMVSPSFYFETDEKAYGQAAYGKILTSAVQSELVKRGMRISSQKAETNYLISLSSNTTGGGSSQGFTVAFLEMNISVKNLVTGETVYEESLNNIKGVQLNADAASIDAYKKGKEKIEQEIIKTMLEAIL